MQTKNQYIPGALQIITYSVGIGALVAAAAYYLP